MVYMSAIPYYPFFRKLTILRLVLFSLIALASLKAFAQNPPPPPQEFPPAPYPHENTHSEEKRILGKILFWDEQLSSDNTMSCGTCHLPSSAGGEPRFGVHPGFDSLFDTNDDIVGSPGVVRRDLNGELVDDAVFGFEAQVTGRASPSFFMGVFSPDNFWDGRALPQFIDPEDGETELIAEGGSLENQAVGPILNSVEMAHDGRTWDDVRTKLNTVIPLLLASEIPEDMQEALDATPSYPALFEAAFGDEGIDAGRIAFAIATYERSLIPDETPWDLFVAGDRGAMTANQIEGWDILRNDTVCLNCHRPPLFTDNNFHNIGLRPAVEDLGRFDVTGVNRDRGRFKTPSLRNVGLKTSLMHVGWVNDVQDALNFYVSGTQNTGHEQFTQNQSGIPNSNLTINQINIPIGDHPEIVDFLANALTDPRVANETFPFDRPTLLSELSKMNTVFVDYEYVGMENGSDSMPYTTINEALVHVAEAGVIRIAPGSLGGPLAINQAVTLECDDGTILLGAE